MAKIKSFEEACKKLGINPEEVKITLPKEMEVHTKALEAHAKLVVITEAINEGWKPDWENGKWDKYYPWFKMGSASGVGFSYVGSDNWNSDSLVGSRLCFKSAKLAEYAGNQFEDLYREYFVLNS